MLLQLIQDSTVSCCVDKIELVRGYQVTSYLIRQDTKSQSIDISQLIVKGRARTSSDDDSGRFGIWFILPLLDWVSINCSTKCLEWCFKDKDPAGLKYLEEEDFDVDLDELFDCTRELLTRLRDERVKNSEKHLMLLHVLSHQILPQIKVTRLHYEHLRAVYENQCSAIKELDELIEFWNNQVMAYKGTLSNLNERLVPTILQNPELSYVFPEETLSIIKQLERERKRAMTEELSNSINGLRDRKKKPSGTWRKSNTELITEMKDLLQTYMEATEKLESSRDAEHRFMFAKTQAILVKEDIRAILDKLSDQKDVPRGIDAPSLYDKVKCIITDMNNEVGVSHTHGCNFIIELCTVTELVWKENPDKIPTNMERDFSDGDFLVVAEQDVFDKVLDQVSTMCAFTVGQLFKEIPGMQRTVSSTRRLILAYENLLYEKITPYIMPLFKLRYEKILNKLTEDIKFLTWDDFAIEEEWLIGILMPKNSAIQTPKAMPKTARRLNSHKEKSKLSNGFLIPNKIKKTISKHLGRKPEKVELFEIPEISVRSQEDQQLTTQEMGNIPAASLSISGYVPERGTSHEGYTGPEAECSSSLSTGSEIIPESPSGHFESEEFSHPDISDTFQRSFELDDLIDEALTNLDTSVMGTTAGLNGNTGTLKAGRVPADHHVTASSNTKSHKAASGNKDIPVIVSSDEEPVRRRSLELSVEKIASPRPINRNRSKSAEPKNRRKNRLNLEGLKSRNVQACPLLSPGSPNSPKVLNELKAWTLKEVRGVVTRQSTRIKKHTSSEDKRHSSLLAEDCAPFKHLFQSSIQCLTAMDKCSSPLQKAQMLVKCLNCIHSTISKLETRQKSPTSSDDLITVAIVLLLNLPTDVFRSVYIQLKFLSSFLDEFMDLGIHNFACIQFTGAMQVIQDQIVTNRLLLSSRAD